jgi:hypothetical protein
MRHLWLLLIVYACDILVGRQKLEDEVMIP